MIGRVSAQPTKSYTTAGRSPGTVLTPLTRGHHHDLACCWLALHGHPGMCLDQVLLHHVGTINDRHHLVQSTQVRQSCVLHIIIKISTALTF